MRLIDVDVFAAELKKRHENIMQDPEVIKRMKWCEAVHYGATTAIIEKMPTIEATPVVHGRWVDRYGGKYANTIYDCSECGKAAFYKHGIDELGSDHFAQALSDVCPNCGAKMDGGVSDG